MANAEWKDYGYGCYQCTHCGMWMGFARYSRKYKTTDVREITMFCSNCGAKMTATSECRGCEYSNNGKWRDSGVCYACISYPRIPCKDGMIKVMYKDSSPSEKRTYGKDIII